MSGDDRPLAPLPPEGAGDLILYRTEDGRTRLDVRLIRDSFWLSLNQLAGLFQRDKSVISKHIKNIFEEGELDPAATVAKFATVQTEAIEQTKKLADLPSALRLCHQWFRLRLFHFFPFASVTFYPKTCGFARLGIARSRPKRPRDFDRLPVPISPPRVRHGSTVLLISP